MDFRLPVSSAIYLFFICLKTSQTQGKTVFVLHAHRLLLVLGKILYNLDNTTKTIKPSMSVSLKFSV